MLAGGGISGRFSDELVLAGGGISSGFTDEPVLAGGGIIDGLCDKAGALPVVPVDVDGMCC